MSQPPQQPPNAVTGRDMCEAIARWQKAEYDKDIKPEDIWNASPTGELSHVFELYGLAEAAGYGVRGTHV